jgi:hypothetical protein
VFAQVPYIFFSGMVTKIPLPRHKKEEMKMKLWDRVQRGMEAGFDAALSAVHTITEKAGEGIELTRLRREKVRIETQVTRLLAELGHAVYDRISVDRLDDITEKLGIKDIVINVAESEARMANIDRSLRKELGKHGHMETIDNNDNDEEKD